MNIITISFIADVLSYCTLSFSFSFSPDAAAADDDHPTMMIEMTDGLDFLGMLTADILYTD
jgi:hypothetical protein